MRAGVVDALDLVDLAEAAGADELAGDPVHGHGALLAADLEHAIVRRTALTSTRPSGM